MIVINNFSSNKQPLIIVGGVKIQKNRFVNFLVFRSAPKRSKADEFGCTVKQNILLPDTCHNEITKINKYSLPFKV